MSRLPPVLRGPSGLAAGTVPLPAGGGSLQLGAVSPHGQHWGLATTIFGKEEFGKGCLLSYFFFFSRGWIKCSCFGSPQG